MIVFVAHHNDSESSSLGNNIRQYFHRRNWGIKLNLLLLLLYYFDIKYTKYLQGICTKVVLVVVVCVWKVEIAIYKAQIRIVMVQRIEYKSATA